MEKDNNTQQEPVASLNSLVLSLSAAALAYMGKQVAPGAREAEPNLPLAKHTISTIEMLKAKTEGNRTEDETKLLDELLYQLRLTYVKTEEELKKAKAKSKKPSQEKDTKPSASEHTSAEPQAETSESTESTLASEKKEKQTD